MSKDMIKTLTGVQYTLKISRAWFINIIDKDDEYMHDSIKTLYERLMGIEGIHEIDYNGHFGARIFIGMEKSADTRKTWKLIRKTVKDYVSQAVIPHWEG